MKPRILVVDDEKNMREILQDLLTGQGYEVRLFAEGESLLAALSDSSPPQLVILDLKLPGKDGLTVLREARALHPELPVLLISAYATVERAVEAVKLGALDFLVKPFDNDRLFQAVGKALEAWEVARQAGMSKPRLAATGKELDIIGGSKGIRSVLEIIHRVAETPATVLISGESGTGKELVARAIHYLSPCRDFPLIAVNCAALPENLLESELFGFERGAFTGAYSKKAGKLELANHGTLFLDEVADLSLSAQAKLLRALEEKEFYPLGSGKKVKIDLRLISATNQHLTDRIQRGLFREDLFYRLNVIPIDLPPLRERKEDIPELVDHFLKKYSALYHYEKPRLADGTMQRLCDYSWPGNIRELEKEVEKLLILGEESWARMEKPQPFAAASSAGNSGRDFSLPAAVARAERETILAALQRSAGNKSEAARLLGVSYKTLFNKIHEHRISFKTEIG
jgi:DNA-binding NtrC family response regulator